MSLIKGAVCGKRVKLHREYTPAIIKKLKTTTKINRFLLINLLVLTCHHSYAGHL